MTAISARRANWTDQIRHNHYVQQFERFVRLTIVAAVPSVYNLLSGGKFDWKTLLAFVVPFAEVAWREVYPTTPPAPVDPPVDNQGGAVALLLVLILLALICFGFGFTLHWLFIAAVVLAVLAIAAAITGR